MPNTEYILAGLLVTFTLAAALIFGFRQLRLLLKKSNTEEQNVLRRSAFRRLLVSGLLAACALLIAAPYVTGLAEDFSHIGRDRRPDAPPRAMTDQELQTARTYGLYWVAIAGLLMLAVTLIAIDMVVIRRYWTKSYQRLKDDRSAMLERQLGRLRSERGYFDNSN